MARVDGPEIPMIVHLLRVKPERWPRLAGAVIIGVALLLTVGRSEDAVVKATNSRTIELYEHYGTYTLDAPPADMRPIILQVPEKFRYGTRKIATRDWGLNILTYYPSFTSSSDPENSKFGLNCAGVCNGRILIAIENRAHSINSPHQYSNSPNMGDYIARATLRWKKTPPFPPNVHVSDITPPDGFDEGFERTSTNLGGALNAPPGHFVSVERFFFRRATSDHEHYDLAATCNMSGGRTTCILHFSLVCNSTVYVSVNGLDDRYLNQSAEIKDAVDKFVSAMIKDPPCQH